jgi:Domain of unknown function (DUF4387)
MKIKLIDVAQVIRSKNSGPFELTFDIIFKEWDMFEKFCTAKVINKALIGKLYNVSEEKVMEIVEFKPAKAIKATIERPISSGELGETDVYGAQQHAPLLSLEFDI